MFKHSLYVGLLATGIYAMWIFTKVGPVLRAYRAFIFHNYGEQIACYAGLFLLTLTLALMLVGRFIWLKDAGRKLQHATKELHQGGMAKTPDTLYELMKAKR
jgi:hypothetical protein